MSDIADHQRTTTGHDWRVVSGFPDYSVSRFGDVVSHRSGKSLSPYRIKGYPAVSLHGPNGRKVRLVHSLIAEAYHGPRPPSLQCAHLDGNKANNRADNLAWVTQTENEAHKRLHGTAMLGEKHHQATLTNEQAEIIRQAVKRALTRREIAALAGVSPYAVEGILDHGAYPSRFAS